MEYKQTKKEINNLCKRLYDTLILENDEYILNQDIDGDYIYPFLKYRKRLYDHTLGDIMSDYQRLCVLTNEELHVSEPDDFGFNVYNRVCMIISRNKIDNLDNFKKFGITVWSNGIFNDDLQRFLVYKDRSLIQTFDCPLIISEIFETCYKYFPKKVRVFVKLLQSISNFINEIKWKFFGLLSNE